MGRRFLLVLLVLAGVVAGIVVRDGRSEESLARHADFTADVRLLKELDAELATLVLRVRFGYLESYDELVGKLAEIDAAMERLAGAPVAGNRAERQRIRSLLDEAAASFGQKAQLVESFKTDNAVLGNSLRYLPAAADHVLAADRTLRDPELDREVRRLLVDGVRAALQPGVVPTAAPSPAEGGPSDEDFDRALRSLSSHADALRTYGASTDAILRDLLAIPTLATLHDLEGVERAAYRRRARAGSRLQLVLYGLVAVLLVHGAWLWLDLRRAGRELAAANRDLERRVEERTGELLRTNNELLHEVAERERVQAELVIRNRELDEFTYVASHDLQEPLRKLISFSSMLRVDAGEGLPPRAEEDLHYITDAAGRMQTLVQDLLALSRAGKQAMKLRSLELDECLDDALEAVSARIQDTGAKIVRRPLPRVHADRTMLTQLLQNLVANALKFTREGVRPVVTVSAVESDGLAAVSVEDNGIGIDAGYLDKIFAPFKRLHGRGEYEGTGIGLAICQKTVERHGGRMSVRSEPGRGSVFTFTVPLSEGAQIHDHENERSDRHHPVG